MEFAYVDRLFLLIYVIPRVSAAAVPTCFTSILHRTPVENNNAPRDTLPWERGAAEAGGPILHCEDITRGKPRRLLRGVSPWGTSRLTLSECITDLLPG